MRTDEDAQYRVNHIDQINQQIFELVYYGRFSFQDCEEMTSIELKWFHTKLIEVKNAENKAKQDAIDSAKRAREAAKNNPYKSRHSKKHRRH